MKTTCTTLRVGVLALLLLAAPAAAQQYLGSGHLQNDRVPSGEMMLYDLILVRPFGLAACGVGLVGSVLAMPFAAMSNSDREVSQRLISEPFAYTFTRPLGHFEETK